MTAPGAPQQTKREPLGVTHDVTDVAAARAQWEELEMQQAGWQTEEVLLIRVPPQYGGVELPLGKSKNWHPSCPPESRLVLGTPRRRLLPCKQRVMVLWLPPHLPLRVCVRARTLPGLVTKCDEQTWHGAQVHSRCTVTNVSSFLAFLSLNCLFFSTCETNHSPVVRH